jgi:hypothetical protein
MLGAPISEVWGDDFKVTKKEKKKKVKNSKPLTPEEMESELLVPDNEKQNFKTDPFKRQKMLRDDRFVNETYKPISYGNSNIVTAMNPYGQIPRTINDDPDYNEFLEYKRNKYNPKPSQNESLIPKIDMNYQMNELLLYVFTGFFLLILYDNIYRLGKNSY